MTSGERATYVGLDDVELINLLRSGEEGAQQELFARYEKVVNLKARRYYIKGADQQDIVQEGLIGLYKAMRDYDANREASFRAFAELCITRQMITAIKSATRQKHTPLNSYVSLNKPVSEDEPERLLGDVLGVDAGANPEELLINNENFDRVKACIEQSLSPFESRVLDLHLGGKSYQVIARTLERSTKSVDNALQRIKRKLTAALRAERE